MPFGIVPDEARADVRYGHYVRLELAGRRLTFDRQPARLVSARAVGVDGVGLIVEMFRGGGLVASASRSTAHGSHLGNDQQGHRESGHSPDRALIDGGSGPISRSC